MPETPKLVENRDNSLGNVPDTTDDLVTIHEAIMEREIPMLGFVFNKNSLLTYLKAETHGLFTQHVLTTHSLSTLIVRHVV
ncbi:hypothetical protein [Vulcanisaeta sp. JCM 16159]|uniref:hypothetical protein n=1 Tax=Vulcanisaeta sp. JCM 16159 TaxID=1295371 RepID=UPI001FB32A3E|nr:hypothetical protein [Vulcanisaeta sp. JCM 16159]